MSQNLPFSAQASNLSRFQSFNTHSTENGGGLTPVTVSTSNHMEIPPKVPLRKESINPLPAKSDLPMHLISTTNQVNTPSPVQQRIPTKLANSSKGKGKERRTNKSHQRTNSAGQDEIRTFSPNVQERNWLKLMFQLLNFKKMIVSDVSPTIVSFHPASIDVNQVLPIRITGKEGGSLRSTKNTSPPSINQPGTVISVCVCVCVDENGNRKISRLILTKQLHLVMTLQLAQRHPAVFSQHFWNVYCCYLIMRHGKMIRFNLFIQYRYGLCI